MAAHGMLTEVLSYPVKSLAGGSHARALVQPWGIAWDRRWMVVNASGRFMTQREHPRMALLRAVAEDGALTLSGLERERLVVVRGAAGRGCVVDVWREAVPAVDCGDAAAAWLSTAIGVACRLVHLADTRARQLRPDYARGVDEVVSFADGFPVLLASRESLDDLNGRLVKPVPMSRFRPNLVIAGAPAWAEDTWRRVRIGSVVFRVDKPCDRCIVTTVDQQTGERPDGNEPLVTLAKFRRDASGKIMFGQNLVPETIGEIHVGEKVSVIEAVAKNWGNRG